MQQSEFGDQRSKQEIKPAPLQPEPASAQAAPPLSEVEISPEVRDSLGIRMDVRDAVLLDRRRDDGVAVLRLGFPGETVVAFGRERVASLKSAVEDLKANPPEGLVIIGPTAKMFCAGADLKVIREITSAEEGVKISKFGQELFNEIERLPCRVVAAISGPCLGGGFELALAADYRIISNSPGSSVGLPETKLGIVPGWGGTQRLPELVGVSSALDLILRGKVLGAEQAKNAGLVDEVVAFENLEERAAQIARGVREPKREIKFPLVDQVIQGEGVLGRALHAVSAWKLVPLFEEMATAQADKKTGGNDPAMPRAVEAIMCGIREGREAGLEKEAKSLGDLIVSPESRSLQNLFFLTEAAKGLGRPGRESMQQIASVVVGAGTMGAAIAASIVKANGSVVLQDISQEQLARAMGHIQAALSKSKSGSADDIKAGLGRVEPSTGGSESVTRANIAIEAIAESMALKKKVLGALAEKMPESAVIATNTSSLSVTEMASSVANPARVAGMHFFHPVSRMPLVEIVRGEQTSDETVDKIAALTVKLGKIPVVVKDVPGFLVNRVLAPYLNEATFLLKDGYSIEEIDRTAKKFGMPMGPLRLLDEVGLDIIKHVGKVLVDGYGERMEPPPFVETLVEREGRLGAKNQKGFYLYSTEKGKAVEVPDAEISRVLEIGAGPVRPDTHKVALLEGKLERFPIVERRLILSIINEAVRCLDEGVAGEPGPDAANQIDLATVTGFGFPAFRGGVMRYAESLGAKRILDELKELEKLEFGTNGQGCRFKPAPGIVARAAEGKSFYEKVVG